MSSSLASIPIAKRRHLAAILGLFSVLAVTMGLVAFAGARGGVIVSFATVAVVTSAVLALMAWGVISSVQVDLRDAAIDGAIEQAIKAHGGQLCDCGIQHDPTELHITDAEPAELAELADSQNAACTHDGAGLDCAHTCDTCVLSTLRQHPAPAVEPGHRH